MSESRKAPRRSGKGCPCHADECGKCPECGGTGLKWYRLPDDVGSPNAVPCPLGCPQPPAPAAEWEVLSPEDARACGLAGPPARPEGAGPAAPRLRLRKAPALLQARIDALIGKAKAGRITPAERRGLDEALDWLDDLAIDGLAAAARGLTRELRGRVTIGVPHCSDGSEFVEIRVEDGLSGAKFAEIKVGLAEFARALAARQVDCAFRLRGMDIVGMRREHKTVEIVHPCPNDHARRRDDLLRGAVAPHEADGWAGDIEDFRNQHNRTGVHRAGEEVYRISFVRYVDPEAAQAKAASEGMGKHRGALRELAGRQESRRGKKTAGAKGKKKAYKRKCHKCTRRATQHTNDPYLSELHPGRPNPKRYWCDHCLSESARDV